MPRSFGKITKGKPDHKQVQDWCDKGLALAELGKYEEAVKCFDKALELKPDYVSAWKNKGVALDKLGKHEEAVKCYERATSLENNP